MLSKTFYLEMLQPRPDLLRPFTQAVVLDEVLPPDAALNRAMYLAVGETWGWRDKASWSMAQWQAYVVGDAAADPLETIITVVLRRGLETLGYFELAVTGSVALEAEIRYFGLLPSALGQGLGAPLLSAAIERGWQTGARRLWVHTCELDHPAALGNYQKRGFEIYRTTME